MQASSRLLQKKTVTVLLMLWLLSAAPAHAADIEVNSTCSLADAIIAANADAEAGGCPAGDGADVIVLNIDVTLASELPFIESEIAIDGNGHFISGNLSYGIFIVSDEKFTLNDVTLKKGRGGSGSAIHALAGGVIIVNRSTIEDNISFGGIPDFGGAIRCDPCNLTIKDSVLRANTSSGPGGAVYFFGRDSSHSLRVYNSNFEKNNAESGGGLYIVTVDPDISAYISNSSFYDNLAAYDGGAIYHGAHESGGELFVLNSTFYENFAWAGGALYTDNYARNTLFHVTFAYNGAGWGSSIYGAGYTNLHNSITMGQYRNEECYGSLESSVGSLSDDRHCDSYLRVNPMLGGLVTPEDGSPPYFPLLPGSPAIDAVECDGTLETDQIGTPRPQGALCDIGAIEYIPKGNGDDK